jgi:L-asparaginase
MSLIAVFSLGGTIAMTGTGGGPVVPTLDAAALLASVPGLDALGHEYRADSFRQIPAGTLAMTDLLSLVEAAGAAAAGGAAGVVVTQGTDTIEETAYLIDLAWRHPVPIVVTGAMRNPSQAGPDGPANLLAAVQVAAAPASRDRGCLVVLADEIHAAGRVQKTHTTSVSAFASPGFGPLGHLAEGQPWYAGPPAPRLAVEPGPAQPRVGLATASLGDDGYWLPAYAEGLDGLVVAGFGVGHVHRDWVKPLAEAAERVPVVLASRIAAGPALTRTYGFAGSETDLLRHGLVPGGRLPALKARLLLWALLSRSATIDEIRTTFAAAG